jgi:DNA polymerase sigma
MRIIKDLDIKFTVDCANIKELEHLCKKPLEIYGITFNYLGFDIPLEGTEYQRTRHHFEAYYNSNNITFSFFYDNVLSNADYYKLVYTKAADLIESRERERKKLNYYRYIK